MISLDVISLYTNVDIDKTIDIIHNNWDIIEEETKIDFKTFKELIKFCVIECNYFNYNGEFYKQKYGLAMGNPLSGTLADIFLEDIINTAMKKLKEKKIKIKTLTKYVDDIFLIINKNDIKTIFKTFNIIDDRLKFTMEEEKDQSIAYLDTLLHRKNGRITTDWFSKPSSSNRILNYYSNHPKYIIINTAKSLASRILTLADASFKTKNIKLIKEILFQKVNYRNIKEKPNTEPLICTNHTYSRGTGRQAWIPGPSIHP